MSAANSPVWVSTPRSRHWPTSVRRQGELRNDQHAAPGLLDVEIHLVVLVAENAVSQHAFAQALRFLLVIALLHAQ